MPVIQQTSLSLAFLLFSCVVPPQCAMAQSASDSQEIIRSDYGSKSNKALIGALEAEVLRLYGEADSKKQTGADSSEWRYGKSVVYFEAGRVSAMLDSGELADRQSVQAIRTETPKKNGDPFGGAWVNPWTPKKGNEALDDLMKDDQ